MMTVKELKDKLESVPDDAVVVYTPDEEYAVRIFECKYVEELNELVLYKYSVYPLE